MRQQKRWNSTNHQTFSNIFSNKSSKFWQSKYMFTAFNPFNPFSLELDFRFQSERWFALCVVPNIPHRPIGIRSGDRIGWIEHVFQSSIRPFIVFCVEKKICSLDIFQKDSKKELIECTFSCPAKWIDEVRVWKFENIFSDHRWVILSWLKAFSLHLFLVQWQKLFRLLTIDLSVVEMIDDGRVVLARWLISSCWRWPGSSRSMVDLQLAVDIASSMSNRAVRKTPGECHRRHMWSYTHDPYCMLQANLFSMKQCWNDVIFTIHEIMHPR